MYSRVSRLVSGTNLATNPKVTRHMAAKIQNVLDALDECPPMWWADRLLWRGLRWFYGMRKRRINEVLRE